MQQVVVRVSRVEARSVPHFDLHSHDLAQQGLCPLNCLALWRIFLTNTIEFRRILIPKICLNFEFDMNRLSLESSPYLKQHAHNPVDWYPWGEEAFQKAKKEGKPLLVSIGYAACHWCHVMERESFEDKAVAEYMNSFFVNIKVDREERPDVDHLFMDALQVMNGQGGWPLNMFATSEGKPFFGGTYFPPKRAYQRASWMETLEAVRLAWEKKSDDIEAQANQLLQHLKQVNLSETAGDELISKKDDFEKITNQLLAQGDEVHGGFGMPPKFPQTMSLRYLLLYHYHTEDKKALELLILSLDNMLAGGIYDQLGGGLSRYSTDAEWLAPHFEKMLYDNALFLELLAEAYGITQDPQYKKAIIQLTDFARRELKSKNSTPLYYAAIDADSEGEEGLFYTWTYEEVLKLAPSVSPAALAYFDIKPGGNWEGRTILRRDPKLAATADLQLELDMLQTILWAERETRIRPLTDTKILLGWNALWVAALFKAGIRINNQTLLNEAEESLNVLWDTFQNGDEWYRNFSENKLSLSATLEDLAFLVKTLLIAAETTDDLVWIEHAQQVMYYIDKHFSDREQLFYYFSSDLQKDILVRKVETYDGALPSVNAVMAENNLILANWTEDEHFRHRARRMLESMQAKIVRYPSSFGYWAIVLLRFLKQKTLAISGISEAELIKVKQRNFLPDVLIRNDKKQNSKSTNVEEENHSSKTENWLLCGQGQCFPPLKEEKAALFKIKFEKMLE